MVRQMDVTNTKQHEDMPILRTKEIEMEPHSTVREDERTSQNPEG